jgi:kelch-like protein 24/35
MSSKVDSFEFALEKNPLPQRLQEYRLKRKFTDVVIRVGDEEFAAHRIVLEDSSPFFKVFFADRWESNGVCKLSEQFVDSNIVDDLLDFLYTAKLTITSENAYSVCIASHFLDIPQLLSASEKFLSERVTPQTVLDLFLLADKLKLEILLKECVYCLLRDCEIIFKDVKLVSFSLEDLQTIICEMNGKKTYSKIKEAMFGLMMAWVENDQSQRSSFLPSLLRSIPLSKLSTQFLTQVVATQSIITDSLSCAELLNEAILNSQQNSCQNYCSGGFGEDAVHLSRGSCRDLCNSIWNSVARMYN